MNYNKLSIDRFCLIFCLIHLPLAATAPDSASPSLQMQENGEMELIWFGKQDSVYFTEHTTSLTALEWSPGDIYHYGEDENLSVPISDLLSESSPTAFFRLRIETGPDFADTESGIGDGLPDWFEHFWFGGLEQGPESDADNDSIQLQDEYRHRLDPTRDDSGQAATLESYSYDFIRLSGASQSGTLSLSYTYDAAGNLIEVSE